MQRKPSVFVLVALALVCGCATPSEVTVVRIVPPKFSIVPAKVVAVVGEPRPQQKADVEGETFLDLFISKLRRTGPYSVVDERNLAAGDWDAYLKKTHADVVLRVSLGEYCRASVVPGSVVTTNDGLYELFAGDCEAIIDLVNPHGGASLGHAVIEGTGRAANYGVALRQARNDAAQQLINTFMPARQHETIALEQTAPSFGAGIERIKKGDLAGARGVWQDALQSSPDSAPLLYNLGAVSEAMRDPDAAGPYYLKATKLAPKEARYRDALDKLNERLDDEEAAGMTTEELTAAEHLTDAKSDHPRQLCAWVCGSLPSGWWAWPNVGKP
ncbi:MAG TPA: hypothetical protein VH087_18405 [Thermoanaerobaculia bacterium]|nr:hypothetical protein [Thermoanaerobaculia bacterium]